MNRAGLAKQEAHKTAGAVGVETVQVETMVAVEMTAMEMMQLKRA